MDKSGCLCADYCSTLDGMTAADKAAFEQQSRVLTCQRKSELVLSCVCGHAAWEHASTEDDELCAAGDAADTAAADLQDNEWASLLLGGGGDPSLLPLSSALAAAMSVATARALLDSDRVSLLRELKEMGVQRLSQRQALANVLGRTRRLAALAEARQANTEAGTFPQRWHMKVEGATVLYEPGPGT